jgi:hypothetical protein
MVQPRHCIYVEGLRKNMKNLIIADVVIAIRTVYLPVYKSRALPLS